MRRGRRGVRLNASPTVEVCLIFLWSVRALICWLLYCAERFLFLAGSGGRGGWQFWGSCLQASFLRSSCGCSFTCCFGAYNQELKETHAPLKVEKVFSCLSQVLFCLSSVCQTEVCVSLWAQFPAWLTLADFLVDDFHCKSKMLCNLQCSCSATLARSASAVSTAFSTSAVSQIFMIFLSITLCCVVIRCMPLNRIRMKSPNQSVSTEHK